MPTKTIGKTADKASTDTNKTDNRPTSTSEKLVKLSRKSTRTPKPLPDEDLDLGCCTRDEDCWCS